MLTEEYEDVLREENAVLRARIAILEQDLVIVRVQRNLFRAMVLPEEAQLVERSTS